MILPNQKNPDIPCEVCGESTRVAGYGQQYGTLEAHWGYGSNHHGDYYRVRLCEPCFFAALT